jgi:formylglycine-generating enzyme required for sulfatase activity
VVGLSYQQVIDYCAWFTERTNKTIKDKKIKKIIFRLPTEEEWEIAANGSKEKYLVFPWGTNSVRHEHGKYKGEVMANFYLGIGDYMALPGSLNSFGDLTVDVSYFPSNSIGLYQMAGNVAEMVSESGICKGGSWLSESYKMVISSRDTFDSPKPWLGVRLFAEVEEFHLDNSMKIDASVIEKNLVRVPSGSATVRLFIETFNDSIKYKNIENTAFYISKFEISNALFMKFIDDIEDPEKKNRCYPKNELWSSETDRLQFLHYATQFPNHPVVNISKDAMRYFCDWLSEIYNRDPKRKYDRVEFALPTMKQQLFVQQCGLDLNDYSWGGPYFIDKKQHYLMNFNPLFDYLQYDKKKLAINEEYKNSQYSILRKSRALDGYELTAPVDAYYPCEYGIYNLNGNVAEAVSDSEIVFGGSFASMLENCSNLGMNGYNSSEQISLPSPQVGFRIVLEEKYTWIKSSKKLNH